MKISPKKTTDTVKVFQTREGAPDKSQYKWWLAGNDKDMCAQLVATAAYLKENQVARQRQTAIYARLYGNHSLFSFAGTNMTKLDNSTGLPESRPTFNLVQSAIDTLVAKQSQNRPQPTFLTDDGDYKERRKAKQLNNFILGEFYRTKAYEKAIKVLRDALVVGTGALKVFKTEDDKVQIERVLFTELFVDANEAIYGDPRQLYHIKLMDRKVLEEMSGKKSIVQDAETAFPDNSSDSSKTIADLVMVVEAWHLPSVKGAKDGKHTIVCSSGVLFKETYEKETFPFVFIPYSDRMYGFWAQGLAEQLMGTQMEINSLLIQISRAVKLIGVPRIFVEKGSKVAKAHFNNDIGTIIEYSGVKPIYEVAPCVPGEVYQQLERLIKFGYQQAGVSEMQAGSEKPAGLNSGEAQRVYDDISTDRFALLSRRYDNLFIDLAYQMIDKAIDIAKETGKGYSTVFPDKQGSKDIDLPDVEMLKDPFVIQCFNMSSLPRDPAGRQQRIIEWMQAGILSIKEGRRLMDFPDLQQVENLANASEERIYQCLDVIVEDGEYTPPDPFMDLATAEQLAVQYFNLYSAKKLEPEKQEMLMNFYKQVQLLKQAAMPQMPLQGMQQNQPMAAPAPQAQSQLLPNGSIG